MAWTTKDAGKHHYSRVVPNYKGSAYGANRPGNWKSGWSPISEMSKPRSTLVGSYYDPSMFNKTPEMWEKNMAGSEPYASPSQGFDRSGFSRGDLGGSNYKNIELANRRGIATLDEEEGMGGLGHFKQWLRGLSGDDEEKRTGGGGFDFPSPFGVVAGAIGKTTRGGRLMEDYQNDAVARGFSKAHGFKEWEADKRKMMTDKERAGYEKYMNLASMTDDTDLKQKYLDTAEQSWRNKNTSDRLAAFTGFEDYEPSHYTGVGEGSRYTKRHPETGLTVPGVEIMSNLLRKYPREVPQDYTDGEFWDIAPDREFALGYGGNEYDRENQIKMLEDRIIPGQKPEPGEFYEYPDERFLPAPYSSPVDPFGGMYESPLTDMTYGEKLIDATPERALHSRHEFLPRDTVGITRMGGGMNAFPEQSWSDWFWGNEPSYDLTDTIEEEEEDYSHYPKGRYKKGIYK